MYRQPAEPQAVLSGRHKITPSLCISLKKQIGGDPCFAKRLQARAAFIVDKQQRHL